MNVLLLVVVATSLSSVHGNSGEKESTLVCVRAREREREREKRKSIVVFPCTKYSYEPAYQMHFSPPFFSISPVRICQR